MVLGTTLGFRLLMEGSSAFAQRNALTIDEFTDLREADGEGTPVLFKTARRLDKVIECENLDFGPIGRGTMRIAGLLVTSMDTGIERPVTMIDTGGFPFDPTGGRVIIRWHRLGMLRLA